MIVYIFGQPGSGKTTLANSLRSHIELNKSLGLDWASFVRVDGDILRHIYKDKDYSKAGRVRNIQRGMDIALWENFRGDFVLCSLVSPYNFQRLWLQQQLYNDQIAFVYLTYNPSDIRGRESFHANDFEEPSGLNNLLTLNTSEVSETGCVEKIAAHICTIFNKWKDSLPKKD